WTARRASAASFETSGGTGSMAVWVLAVAVGVVGGAAVAPAPFAPAVAAGTSAPVSGAVGAEVDAPAASWTPAPEPAGIVASAGAGGGGVAGGFGAGCTATPPAPDTVGAVDDGWPAPTAPVCPPSGAAIAVTETAGGEAAGSVFDEAAVLSGLDTG